MRARQKALAGIVAIGAAVGGVAMFDALLPAMSATSATPTSKFLWEAKTVTCAATVTDADNILQVGCFMRDPSGEHNDVECYSTTPVSGDDYECTIDFNEKYAQGVWKVTHWSMDDAGERAQVVDDSIVTVNVGGLTYSDCEAGSIASGEGLTLSITVADNNDIWYLGEFHKRVSRVVENAPTACQVATDSFVVPVPAAPSNYFFWSSDGPCTYQDQSVLGESIKWDSTNDVAWFSQGGTTFGSGTLACDNHSRVGSYDPTGNTFVMYNLPGNRNEAHGLYVDEAESLILVAECGWYGDWDTFSGPDIAHQGAIMVFDPATVVPGGNALARGSWASTMDPELCVGAETAKINNCYQRIDMPAAGWNPANAPEVGGLCPSHIAKDANGDYWFTNFWGSTIGRLQLDTETVTLYEMPATRSTAGPGVTVGGGPWEIEVKDGYVYFNEYFDCQFGRMLVSDGDNVACETLSGGENTCVQWVDAKVGKNYDGQEDTCHSFAFDSTGVFWFGTIGQLNDVPGETGAQIGFIDRDWTVARLLGSADTDDYNPNSDVGYSGMVFGLNDTLYVCQGPGPDPATPGVTRLER